MEFGLPLVPQGQEEEMLLSDRGRRCSDLPRKHNLCVLFS